MGRRYFPLAISPSRGIRLIFGNCGGGCGPAAHNNWRLISSRFSFLPDLGLVTRSVSLCVVHWHGADPSNGASCGRHRWVVLDPDLVDRAS